MKKNTFRYRIGALTLVALAALAGCGGGGGGGEAAPSETLVSLPASALQWREVPGTGGIRAANVRGEILGQGPYEAFVEFPAGYNNPQHFHTQALPTVVLSGVFYAIFEDGRKVQYPAGSYYFIPGKLPHFSGCEPGANCLLFQYQTDHFDLVPTPATR